MAATDIIAQLAVNLSMETAQFESGATKAERRAKKMGKNFDSVGSKITGGIGNSLKGFAAGLAGAFTVGALFDLARGGLEYASSLGEVSAQLGVTSAELQEFRYAASQTGVEEAEMDKALAKLTRTIGEAAIGSKSAVAAFQQIGINIRDSAGNVRTAGDLIPEVADKIKAIHDPAQRAALLVDLFGKSGQKLLPLLSEGAKGVNELTAKARELGIVMSDEQIAKADDAADKWAAYSQVLKAQVAVAVVELLNGLQKFNAFMDTWSVGVGKNVQSLKDAFGQLVGPVAAYLDRVRASADSFKAAMAQLATTAIQSMARLAAGVRQHLIGGLEQTWNTVKTRAKQAGDAFYNMWDRVVGHSYVPDMVEGIRAEMARLDAVLVQPAKASTQAAGDAFKALEARVASLLSELFPQEARRNQFNRDLADLKAYADKAKWSVEQLAAAIKELEKARGIVTEEIGELPEVGDEYGIATGEMADKTEDDTARMAEAYSRMAQDVAGSLQNLVGSIKQGGVLNILQGVLDVVSTVLSALGQAGVKIGGTPASAPPATPRASGGPVVPNRVYKVGERGPEYVSFGSRGYVTPNRAVNDQVAVRVVPSPFFEVVVDRRAGHVAAPMAGRAAVMGAQGGAAAVYRQAGRRIP